MLCAGYCDPPLIDLRSPSDHLDPLNSKTSIYWDRTNHHQMDLNYKIQRWLYFQASHIYSLLIFLTKLIVYNTLSVFFLCYTNFFVSPVYP